MMLIMLKQLMYLFLLFFLLQLHHHWNHMAPLTTMAGVPTSTVLQLAISHNPQPLQKKSWVGDAGNNCLPANRNHASRNDILLACSCCFVIAQFNWKEKKRKAIEKQWGTVFLSVLNPLWKQISVSHDLCYPVPL